MNFAEFYYETGADIVTARGSLPSGKYYLYCVSVPNLSKTISTEGIYSPTGETTNRIRVQRSRDASPRDLIIPEGFHSTEELVNAFNLAFRREFGSTNNSLEFITYGTSQAYIRNNDSMDWSIDFLNETTRIIFMGKEGLTQQFQIEDNISSTIFTRDPFLGNLSTILKIQNGESILLNNTGGWLEGGTLYLTEKIKVNSDNVNVVEMYADFPSLNIYKKLYSPITSLVRLGYKGE